MPEPNLGLTQLPAQPRRTAVDNRRKVDQAGLDVAQLQLPLCDARNELGDARLCPLQARALIGRPVLGRLPSDLGAEVRCADELVAQLGRRTFGR